MNKINKWTGTIYSICALLVVSGAVLKILHYLPLLGTILFIAGNVGGFLLHIVITRKHLNRKDATGKKLRICYAVCFSVIATGIILILIQGWDCTHDFLRQIGYLSFVFLGLTYYLGNIQYRIEREEKKLEE